MGFLPGDDYSFATAISADGNAVVGFSKLGSGDKEAFRWTASEGMIGLGFLPADFPVDDSAAWDVSADGAVIVGIGKLNWWYGEPWSETDEAFYWTESGGMQGLGVLPGADYYRSTASGVSADGSVVVGTSKVSYSDCAFRWTSENGMVSLGYLSDTYHTSGAKDVCADGSIVVGCSRSGPAITEAFRWTQSEGMVGLGFLPDSQTSEAWCISADGSVVAGLSRYESGYEAFRWTATEGMTGLGFIESGALISAAFDMSADGSIIVGMSQTSDPNLGEVAFIWRDSFGMQSLKDVLENTYGLDLTDWTLISARGISADGLKIVGDGIDPNGHTQAWVATLEEPGPSVILSMNAEPNYVDTISPNIGQHAYYPNWPVVVNAESFIQCPDVYRFDHWQGDVTSPNSPSTVIIMDTNKTLTAVYAADERTCGDECHPILQGDLNEDCYINFEDFSMYAAQWLSCTHPDCD
ncbi:MAG: hypothetical protein JW806_01190 [Sedimentisphaerales bacterium]|nr:hypothetical protein [Sedimentisphaerales bacterium]